MNTSSAKRLITCLFPSLFIPVIVPSCLIICARGSIYRANNVGLRQQPHLVPLFNWNLSDKDPFTLTRAVDVL